MSFSANTTIGGWTFNAGASSYTFTNGHILYFNGAGIVINGGSATITNNVFLSFFDSSTAGSATITNNNNSLQFFNTSTAGSATITNNSDMRFHDSSTAGSAAITNNNLLLFFDSSTAGSATITNNVVLRFFDSSAAGSATITNNNVLAFFNTSTAGNATITNNVGGVVDFSGSAGPANDGKLSAGSIAGAGNYYLGARELTVGGNNLSTTVSGVISDCGPTGISCANFGATGGSLVKVGTGTLTLTGANTYTGGTTVNAGTLALTGAGTLGFTTGATTVNGGTLDLGGTTQTQNGGVHLTSGTIRTASCRRAARSTCRPARSMPCSRGPAASSSQRTAQ